MSEQITLAAFLLTLNTPLMLPPCLQESKKHSMDLKFLLQRTNTFLGAILLCSCEKAVNTTGVTRTFSLHASLFELNASERSSTSHSEI